MNNSFTVEWEVEDGYVGKSRPHNLRISSDDLDDCDEDEIEIESILWELVQSDFENKISWYIKNKDEFMMWAKEKIREMKEDEDN